MRIVCLSDTHDRQRQITVPAGDLLIHAGDLTMKGTTEAIYDGFAWLSGLPHRKILFVPGNHDFAFERTPAILAELASQFPRVEVLLDREVTYAGYRIYGSPYQPWFHDWAFNFPRGASGATAARAQWASIPDYVEILVTHGPARGILDRTVGGESAGCDALRARIEDLSHLRLHVCGHIHEAYGTERVDGVLYVNASACDFRYRPIQKPIVLDLTDRAISVVA